MSSLFCNCSPQSYRLLRDKKFLILLRYSTIRSVSPNSLPQRQNKMTHFLMYIKNKCKSLLPNDKTVVLTVDETHLKPYFDYKGGNSVHLLRCTRNNWLGQKDTNKTMKFPRFSFDGNHILENEIHYAPFSSEKTS